MAKPILSIRRLLKTIVAQFVEAAREGCRCSADLTVYGSIEVTDEDDIGVTVKPKHRAFREILEAEASVGSDSLEDHESHYELSIRIEVGE